MNKLTVLLLAVASLLVAIACTGCQSPPDLTPDAGTGHKLGGANGAPGPGTVVTLTADGQAPVLLSGQFGPQKSVTLGIASGGDGSAWSGTLLFQGSADGINWFSIPCNQMSLEAGVQTATLVANQATVNGLWFCNVGGLYEFQVQAVTVGDGSANVVENLIPEAVLYSYSVVDGSTGLMVRTNY